MIDYVQKHNDRVRAYCEKNRESIQATQKQYRTKNKDKLALQAKERYQVNKLEIARKGKKHRLANKEKLIFKQIEPILHKWANKFQNNIFEHWELVNAVWAKGNVQCLSSVKLAHKRIKWDMIDYMRDITGFRMKKNREAKGTFYPETVSLSSPTPVGEELVGILSSRRESADLDTKDWFDWLLENFDRTDRLIIKLRFIENLTQREIGKAIGMSAPGVSLRLMSALRRIRVKLVKENPSLSKKRPIGNCRLARTSYKGMYQRKTA